MGQEVKIALAPMEGVVDPVIREVYSLIGGYDLMFTEFVRVTSRLNPASVFYKYCPELRSGGKTKYGTPVYVQLLGSDTSALVDNAMVALELGALGIDMNFGCPAKTVNRHDGGAALLKGPDRVFNILSEMRRQLPKDKPLSAKIRLGFEDTHLLGELSAALREIPLLHLTVHARTKAQGYKPPAHWHEIKTHFSGFSYPIYANGDIWTYSDFLNCVEATGCDHFALGRGAFALPNLGLQIKGENPVNLAWSLMEKEILPLFVKLSNDFRGDHFALCRLKQWLKFLGRNYPQATEKFEQIKRLKELNPNLLSQPQPNLSSL